MSKRVYPGKLGGQHEAPHQIKPADSLRPGTTVVVISYNHADFVTECLDSIRTQTQSPARVLIADDCSPDNTREVITEYCKKFPGFAEFHPNESNIGLNRTLNRLLEITDTEYFTYISADDFMMSNRISAHEQLLANSSSAVLAYSDAVVVDEKSTVAARLSSDEFPWPLDEHDRTDAYAALMSRNWIPAASIFLRTSELRLEGGYNEEIFYEDYELLVRLAKHHSFTYSAEPLVAVRRLSTSLGSTGFASSSPRFISALNTIWTHYSTAEETLAEKSYSLRWELAKRSISTSMSRRDSLQLLLANRRGAEKRMAFPYQLFRLVKSLLRK